MNECVIQRIKRNWFDKIQPPGNIRRMILNEYLNEYE